MKYILRISQEHPSLPLAEVKAVLEGKILEKEKELVIVECRNPDDLKSLAFTFEFGEIIFDGALEEFEKIELHASKLLDSAESKQLLGANKLQQKRFMVKISGNPALARRIGGIIQDKTHAPVDLENPEDVFIGFMLGGRLVLAKRLFVSRRGDFEERKVKYRPYFHPTSMHPKFCRLLVNLSGVKKGRMLDPFSGTGGILIESAMLGNETYGSDIDNAMVFGARENLAHAGVKADVRTADARKISKYFKMKFDAIVTDPPYGRSSTLMGEKIQSLYGQFLNDAKKILKKKGKIVIVAPVEVDMEKAAKGYRIEQKHLQRVHKSLYRHFFVLSKKDKPKKGKKKDD